MGTAIQAGLYPNPVVAYAAEQIGVGGTVGEFHGAIFRQEIVTAGKLRLSREKYLQRVAVAEALAVAQQYRVCNDIRIHYYEVLGHIRLVQIHRELVKSAEDAALTARELYNVGQANRAAVLQSNVRLQRVQLNLLDMENRCRQGYRRLSSAVGTELAVMPLQDELDGHLEAIDFQSAWLNLWENSPELLAARAKLRGDQIALARERVQPIPNLEIEGGLGYNFEAEETVAVAGVGVKLPIWDRNQGTIQQAQSDLARQQAEVCRLELALQRDLADAYAKYMTALQHVAQYRKVILLSERMVRYERRIHIAQNVSSPRYRRSGCGRLGQLLQCESYGGCRGIAES
jgi:outer membrane protein TolC